MRASSHSFYLESFGTRVLRSLSQSIALKPPRISLRPLLQKSRPLASSKLPTLIVVLCSDYSNEQCDAVFDSCECAIRSVFITIMRWTVQHHLALVGPPQSLSSLNVMADCLTACFPHHKYFGYYSGDFHLFSLPHY